VSCAKNGWTDLSDLHTSYDVLFAQGVAFAEGFAVIAPASKLLAA